MAQIRDLKTGIKHKNTPIGKIPVDWELVRLGDICSISSGGASNYSKDVNEKTYPVYGSNGLLGSYDEFNFSDGLVIGRVGASGSIHMISSPVWASDNTLLLSITDRFAQKLFIYYYLQKCNLPGLATKTAQPLLTQQILKSVLIAKPNIYEQKKIADILTTLDEAIEKTVQIIEKNKEVKKGLMQELLTRGIGHKKFKKTKIGEIPEEWEVGKLSDIAYVIMGQSPPGNTYNIEGAGYPILNGPTEFTDYSPTPIQFTTQPTKVCKAHDILFCVRGSSTGRMNIADQEYCIGRGLAAIREKSVSDTRYIYYILASFTSTIFAEASGAGSTFPNISREALEDTNIAIPPLYEQKNIADILSSVDEEIKKEANDRYQLETLKKGLMQVLLTGKIRISV